MVAMRLGAASIRIVFAWVWCLLIWLAALPSYADVISIQYQATELSSSTGSWQYAYEVKGFDFLSGDWFFIDFGNQLYANLQDQPPAPNADWFVLTIPPSPPLWPGEYGASALIDAPSLAAPFTVTFTWLGGVQSLPGAQTFTVYDSAFNVLATSGTSPLNGSPPSNSVPLPGTAWLCGVGLVGLLAHRKKAFPKMTNSAGLTPS